MYVDKKSFNVHFHFRDHFTGLFALDHNNLFWEKEASLGDLCSKCKRISVTQRLDRSGNEEAVIPALLAAPWQIPSLLPTLKLGTSFYGEKFVAIDAIYIFRLELCQTLFV